MSEKSALKDSFSFLAFAEVISSREKSKTCIPGHGRINTAQHDESPVQI